MTHCAICGRPMKHHQTTAGVICDVCKKLIMEGATNAT